MDLRLGPSLGQTVEFYAVPNWHKFILWHNLKLGIYIYYILGNCEIEKAKLDCEREFPFGLLA